MDFTVTISDQRIAELLCCGIEGGVGYWARIVEYIKPTGELFKWCGDDSGGFPHIQYPMSEGGAVIFCDAEDEDEKPCWRLDREALIKGIKIMAEKYPIHFGDFMREHDDAETGDVFVQCCVLGEIVFG